MAKAKFGGSKKNADFGRDLIAASREALAHKQGKFARPIHFMEDLPAPREEQIRKKVAKSQRNLQPLRYAGAHA